MSSRSLVALLLIMFAPVVAMAAETKLRALHIEGAPATEAVWLVEVFEGEKPDARYSRIHRRGEGDVAWNLVTKLPAEVTQVSRYGNDLVTLLASGEWMIIGQSSGRQLPGGGKIISIAGDGRSLFAVGEQMAPAPATRPDGSTAVETPATATAPTTRPAELALYHLVQGAWQMRSPLPRDAGHENMVLGVVGGAPALAALKDGTLRLWQFTNEGKWVSLGSVETAGKSPAKILEESGHTFVYVSAQGAPSQLLVRNSQWLAPISLPADSDVRGIGLAGGQIRFVYAEEETIKERRLSPRDLQIQGSDTALQLPDPLELERYQQYVHGAMMAIIALVMIHTYRKREEYRQVKLDFTKIQLAPFGRRFFAGMIDLVPVLGALLYARLDLPGVETITDVVQSIAASKLIGVGIVVFLLHTTIVEAIFGRSLGKIVTHLQVLSITGKRPSLASLLIRNVLRVVDVVLWFTLILMVYMPLRQRLGDLAAGTVVVMDRKHDLAGPDA